MGLRGKTFSPVFCFFYFLFLTKQWKLAFFTIFSSSYFLPFLFSPQPNTLLTILVVYGIYKSSDLNRFLFFFLILFLVSLLKPISLQQWSTYFALQWYDRHATPTVKIYLHVNYTKQRILIAYQKKAKNFYVEYLNSSSIHFFPFYFLCNAALDGQTFFYLFILSLFLCNIFSYTYTNIDSIVSKKKKYQIN